MFKPKWTEVARAEYKRLEKAAKNSLNARKKSSKTKSSKAEGLFKQVQNCIQKLLQNPKHPGLKTHEYSSLEHPYDKKKKVFEAYAQNQTPGAYRVFWCYGPGDDEITIVAITPHP